MSEFFDNVTGEELVAQLEELGYKLIEKEQKVKSVDLADVGGNEVACDHDYKPIGGGFEKRCVKCNYRTVVE